MAARSSETGGVSSATSPTGCAPADRMVATLAGRWSALQTQTWLTSAKSWSSVASQKTGAAGSPAAVSQVASLAACSALYTV